jgi:hypothetical protein
LIGKGLEEGEKVVVDGQNQLRAGSKVQVREPGRPGEAGKPPGAQAGPPAAAQGPQARDGGKGARE